MSKNKKVIYRDPDNGKVFGVCAGLSDYFEIDVVLMRIIWLLLILFAGSGLLAYIIVAIVLEPKSVVLARQQKENENIKYEEKKKNDDPFAGYDDDPFAK